MEVTKLVIVEPFTTGHHISLYLRSILLKLRSLKHVDLTLVTSQEVLTSRAYLNLLNEPGVLEPEVIEINLKLSSKYLIIRLIKAFVFRFKVHRELSKRFSTGLVYWNTLDFVSKTFWLIPKFSARFKYYGIQMKEGNLSRLRSLFKENKALLKLYAFLQMRMGFEKIATIDLHLFELLEGLSANRIFYVGDPTNLVPTDEKRIEKLNIERKKEVNVLVFGSISSRKGIGDLKDLLVGYGSDKNFRITIAGSVSSSFLLDLEILENQLNEENIKVETINRWISSDEEKTLFEAADLVWVAYNKKFTGSSGVLFSACTMGKPVIARDTGYISYLVEKYSIGILCDFNDLVESRVRLSHILDTNSAYNMASANAIKMSRFHTSDSFASGVLDMLNIAN